MPIFIWVFLSCLSAVYARHRLDNSNRFLFFNPGYTYTKNGSGIEFSCGKNGFENAKLLTAGLVSQYEFRDDRLNLGAEAGYLFLQMETSYSLSNRGNSVLVVPNLCVPFPWSARFGAAVNVFYRAYLQESNANSLGASIKLAVLKP
jgi:hypothetical protein